jgi:hypothetical protein
MQFLLLLWGDETAELAATPEERRTMVDAHIEFSRGLRERGVMVGGDALTPSRAGAVVRGDEVTDGPFIETKEQLGGYYLIEVGSREEAIEIAKAVPETPGSVVEVREIPTY